MKRLVVCRVEKRRPGDPEGLKLRPLASWPADTILDDLKRYEAERSKPKERT